VPRAPRDRSVVIETPHGVFHGPAGDLVTRQLAEFGGHTRNELAMVLSFVAEGDIVLDVGGHIGTFAIPLARKVGRQGRVFAFEPTPSNHDFLVRNVRENGVEGIVHVELLGASDRAETLRAQRPAGNTSAAFLTESGDGEVVHTVLLDEWWRTKTRGDRHRIALIKIDAEGMDCRVLKGARRILEQDQPVLYFELNPPALARAGSSVRELEELLESLHYHCFVNLGPRNSATDSFRLGRIRRARDLGSFGDVLAFPRGSLRYPGYFAGPAMSWCALRVRAATDLPRRALRRLRRVVAAR
jgi:FkbM family methyltransferase